MTLDPGMATPTMGRSSERVVGRGAWAALRPLVLGRLLVASVALPAGLLLRPELLDHPLAFLTSAMMAVVAVSLAWALAARFLGRPTLQWAIQLAVDLAFVTWLATYTGGRGSQFVMFYGLVVVAGGLLGGLAGGLGTALAALAAFAWLPRLASPIGASFDSLVAAELVAAFLAIMGVLAGLLGVRARRAAGDLAETRNELDRVRLDHDAILRHLATGILTVDGDGRVGYLNPAAANVLGLEAGAVQGRPFVQVLPLRLAPLRDLVMESHRTRHGRARAEVEVVALEGRTLPLGISTNVLEHEGRLTGVVAVFQDLTAVRDMERRARRNETLAEIGALAAGIAHELRNGLKPISGSVEVLQRELKLEGESAELMDLVARESGRLNKFVTDLLSYSRERDLVLAPVELEEELRSLVNDLRHDPRRAPGVEVEFVPGPDGARVAMDTEQMRQVWLNLASNALEAMTERGTLRVTWVARGGDQVAVEFRDEGPGIPADDKGRVGEPFFTTKRGGTGLGLAIAQRIVERHGGVLTLESVVGQGTTARVQLPARPDSLAQAA